MIDPLIRTEVRAIEFCCVDVCDERNMMIGSSSCSRAKRHPVVTVDNIRIRVFRERHRKFCEFVHSCTQVICVERSDAAFGNVGRDRALQKTFRRIVGLERTFDANGSALRFGRGEEGDAVILFRLSVWEDECHFCSVLEEPSHKSLTGNTQTSEMFWRIFPAKHECMHGHFLFFCIYGCFCLFYRQINLKIIAHQSQKNNISLPPTTSLPSAIRDYSVSWLLSVLLHVSAHARQTPRRFPAAPEHPFFLPALPSQDLFFSVRLPVSASAI